MANVKDKIRLISVDDLWPMPGATKEAVRMGQPPDI